MIVCYDEAYYSTFDLTSLLLVLLFILIYFVTNVHYYPWKLALFVIM